MKKIIKIMSILIVTVLLFAGCNTGTKSERKKIGVLQIVTHPSLDIIYEGFVEELARQNYIDGETIDILYQNAQNDQANLKSMSEKLVKESELILAIATPAAQAVAAETKELPLIVGAISDPIGAGLVTNLEHPGGNITGVKHETPVEKQIELLKNMSPDIKTIGFLYNAAETNSTSQIKRAKAKATELGVAVEELTVSSTNDVQQAAASLAAKVDGIYVPNDNTIAASMPTLKLIMEETKTPLVAAAITDVEVAGVATIGVEDKQMGVEAAKQAIQILEGKKKPGDIPMITVAETELIINDKMAGIVGIDVNRIKAFYATIS